MSYRPIDTKMWRDDYLLDLTPNEKLLFVYLLTNDFTTQSGIYKISLNHVQMETGLNQEAILSGLQRFHQDEKIVYNLPTKELAIINWRKYNENKSWKTMTKVAEELKNIKEPFLTLFLYDPREPLARWTPKSKNGEETTEQIVWNPMMQLFGDYTDSQLLDAIKQFREGVLKGYRSGIDTPYYITEQTHNKLITNSNSYTNSDSETKTEPGAMQAPSEFSSAYPDYEFDYSLPEEPETIQGHDRYRHSASILQKIIAESENMKAFPTERKSIMNHPAFGKIQDNLSYYSTDEISQALRNYEAVYNSLDHEIRSPFMSIGNFLMSDSLKNYIDENNPMERFMTRYRNGGYNQQLEESPEEAQRRREMLGIQDVYEQEQGEL
jgi:hypothetical protein